MRSKQNVAIVGASIAGCAAAILLERAGCRTTVFEKRQAKEMEDLGGGLVLPTKLIYALQKADLLDQDFPFMPLCEREFYHLKRRIGAFPMEANAVHWGVLYNQLVRRVPAKRICYQQHITDIEDLGNKVELRTKSGAKNRFDAVLCADGYRSLGRKILFPNAHPKFTDYICWQGVYISESSEFKQQLFEKVLYCVYDKGVFLAYEIPALEKKAMHISWFFYEVLHEKHPLILDQKAHANIYKNEMKREYINYLYALADLNLLPLAKEIVMQTEEPFTHAIYDTLVPDYTVGNIALIGDAGILLRPHLGSGATKSLEDALRLLEYETWAEWGKVCQQKAAHLFELSRAFGDFLVDRPPQWKTLDEVNLKKMWNDIVSGYQWYQHR